MGMLENRTRAAKNLRRELEGVNDALGGISSPRVATRRASSSSRAVLEGIKRIERKQGQGGAFDPFMTDLSRSTGARRV